MFDLVKKNLPSAMADSNTEEVRRRQSKLRAVALVFFIIITIVVDVQKEALSGGSAMEFLQKSSLYLWGYMYIVCSVVGG